MQLADDNLIWIDLEMTGLDPQADVILEIATAVTDPALSEVVQGPAVVIHQPAEVLARMNEWNQTQHAKSGLIQAVEESTDNCVSAAVQTLDFLARYVPQGCSPMCGNTICQDRRFLARLMPDVESYFHYRHLDVTTLKELARRWHPELRKQAEGSKAVAHRAMDDILESIEELRFYRRHFINLPPSLP